MVEIRKMIDLEKLLQYKHATLRFTLLLDQIKDSLEHNEEVLAQPLRVRGASEAWLVNK